ncbi:MAG: bacteriophage holin [Candidatus Omnitrophica bacterium]|nr:bacteriophage holin [Candidatus Omnitrophota bacterium]
MAKLDAKALALSFGIVWAAGIFIVGIISSYVVWGDGFVRVMQSLYLGYYSGIFGSLVGAAWGFVDGYIGGLIIAWLYNRFAK